MGELIIICLTVVIVAAIAGTTVEKCNYNKYVNENYEDYDFIDEEDY